MNRNRRLFAGFTLLTLSIAVADTVAAHPNPDEVLVVSPINGAATFNRFGLASPANHHIVYANNGVKNDVAVDIHAAPNSSIVTPFRAVTNTGHAVESKIIRVRPACASGVLADGGSVVTIQARDVATGQILGYADIAHVNNPAKVGTVLGAWTQVGTTARFRKSTCYQVTNDNGVHVHFELQQPHRYACLKNLSAGSALTGTTRIGVVGSHNYRTQRAVCV